MECKIKNHYRILILINDWCGDIVYLFFFFRKTENAWCDLFNYFNNIQYKWKVLLYIYTIGSERELVVSKLARPVQ